MLEFFKSIMRFLIASTLAFAMHPVLADKDCSKLFMRIKAFTPKNENRWDSSQFFIDPRNHSATEFRYLVTAINKGIKIPKDTFLGRSSRLIFTSLISNSMRSTHWFQGFIVRVKSDHVVYTSSLDGASPVMHTNSLSEAKKYIKQNCPSPEVQSPGTILKSSDPANGNNEILLIGENAKGEVVEITGVWTKNIDWLLKEYGSELFIENQSIQIELKNFAMDHQLPVIHFN